MLPMQNVTFTKCYLYKMLPIQNVTYTKSYLYQTLPRQSVLDEMLLYENVLYETKWGLKKDVIACKWFDISCVWN